MAVLRPCPVSRELFTDHRGVLVSEMSTIGTGFGRAFDDATDQGLTITTPLGHDRVFAVVNEEWRDGELLWWDLREVRPGGASRVRVFND